MSKLCIYTHIYVYILFINIYYIIYMYYFINAKK